MSSLVKKLLKKPRVSKLLSRSAIYALGDLMTKGARYITIPIFVACLTAEDIGIYSVLQAITMICWALTTLGFGAAVRRYYASSDGKTDDNLIAKLWQIRLLLGAIPAAFLIGLLPLFGNGLFPNTPLIWVAVAIATGYLRAGTDTIESWYIIRQEPVAYRTFTFLKFLTTTILVLTFVVAMGWGVLGAIAGEAIGALAWCIIAGMIAFKQRGTSSENASETSLRTIFRYSLPIIPHAVCLWMLVSIDRIILQQYVSEAAIGVYEIAYMYAALMMVVATAINASWLPDFFRTGDDKDGPAKYAKTANVYFSCVFAFGCMLSILAPDLIALATWGKAAYQDASSHARIVLLGIGCQTLVVAFSQPLFFTKRTATLAATSATGVLVNLIANYFLDPWLGVQGAAWSTVLAYGTMFFCLAMVVHNTYRIPWNYVGLAGCAIVFACLSLNPVFDQGRTLYGTLTRLAFSLLVGAAVLGWFRWTQKNCWNRAQLSVSETT